MAPKVSISKRLSKIHSNNVSFKNKRRRKSLAETCAPSFPSLTDSSINRCNPIDGRQTNKSPKHRWKLNKIGRDEKSISDGHCMTNARHHVMQKSQLFHRQFPQNNLPHHVRNAGEKRRKDDDGTVKNRVDNVHHFINAKSSQHDSYPRKQTHIPGVSTGEKNKPQRRDFVNCRKLCDWTTASSVRKLLPIFILVNMLPFLYAGELSIKKILHAHCWCWELPPTRIW